MEERLSFEREIDLLAPERDGLPAPERETDEGLRRRVKHLSLLPHRAEQGGKDVELGPAVADPKIYDGPASYKIAPTLQQCLMSVMRQREFAHIRVALADLTGARLAAPDFAGYKHKEQVFVASAAKLAAMLAAFQLRQDLKVAPGIGTFAKIEDLFGKVRDNWAATQVDPGGKPKPFAAGIQLRGKVVLVRGAKVDFRGKTRKGTPIEVPKAPRLDDLFTPVAPVAVGKPFTVGFNKSGETPSELSSIVRRYNLSEETEALEKAKKKLAEARKERGKARTAAEKARTAALVKEAQTAIQKAQKALGEARRKQPDAAAEIRGLAFWERLGIAIGGLVPASNFAVSTVVADVGFHAIASTLLQTGLYDPNRGGGLWLGADFSNSIWRGPPAGGSPQSATAASLVSLMTLMTQGALMSGEASAEMQVMMQKPSPAFPGTLSWFKEGLRSRNPRLVLSKIGLHSGADEVAHIGRDVEVEVVNSDGSRTTKTTPVRYVVAALRARNPRELMALIREVDNCVLANNGLPVNPGMRLPS